MFVQLSDAIPLWRGVFPILVKWIDGKDFRLHCGWIGMLVCWALLVPWPVLLMIFAVASTYDLSYLRCHLGTDWISPFIIIPHVFTKFSTHRAFAASFFISLTLFLLLYQALLLLTTTANIMELVTSNNTSTRKRQRHSRLTILFLSLVIVLLGLPLLQRTGFYWIRLTVTYMDRLLVITALFQAIGYLTVNVRPLSTDRRKPIKYVMLIIFYGTLIFIATIAYSWYAMDVIMQPPPDTQCHTYTQAPQDDPVRNVHLIIGWAIALFPVLIGSLITYLKAWRFARRNGQSIWWVLFNGTERTDEANHSDRRFCRTMGEPSAVEPGMYHFAMHPEQF